MYAVPILLACIIAGLVIYLLKDKNGKLPPGPRGLPLLGNLLGLDLTKVDTYRMLRKRYGDIFTVALGPTKVVYINGYDNIVDALVKNADTFSDRPKGFINTVMFDHSSKTCMHMQMTFFYQQYCRPI